MENTETIYNLENGLLLWCDAEKPKQIHKKMLKHIKDFDALCPKKVAILKKEKLLAILSCQISEDCGTILRIDPREEKPDVQYYESPEKAIEWFDQAISTSIKNKWHLVGIL